MKHVHDTPLILVGKLWSELVDWAKKNLLNPALNLASPEDMDIPECVPDADAAIARLKDEHAAWVARNGSAGEA